MRKDFLQFRVRYGETDQMGVVYYGNYAQYFEMGRTEWLRKFGFSYKWMEDNGIMLPVTELRIQYKRPALYDDLLTVTTVLVKMPTVRIEFDYEIHNQQGQLLTTGYTSLAFVDKATGKVIHAPDYLSEKIKQEES